MASAVIILWMRPANERRRYIVTSSLIGWAHPQNDPCLFYSEPVPKSPSNDFSGQTWALSQPRLEGKQEAPETQGQ